METKTLITILIIGIVLTGIIVGIIYLTSKKSDREVTGNSRYPVIIIDTIITAVCCYLPAIALIGDYFATVKFTQCKLGTKNIYNRQVILLSSIMGLILSVLVMFFVVKSVNSNIGYNYYEINYIHIIINSIYVVFKYFIFCKINDGKS